MVATSRSRLRRASITSRRGSIPRRARCSASSPGPRARRSCASTSARATRLPTSTKFQSRCDVTTRIRVLIALSFALVFVAGIADASGKADLAAVRQATEKYHDLSAALADGYVEFYKCTEQPGVGTM